jgi:lysozyme family protein
MADFQAAYPAIFGNEVGYVNDPKDKGGETMNGITRKNYPTWAGWAIVDKHKPLGKGARLPELDSLTKQFYKRTQWDAIKSDAFDSQVVAAFVCDWYVNSQSHAAKALQEAVGVTVDGLIGDATIHAVNACDEHELLAKLKAARISFYKGIVANDPSQKKFLDGWLDRTARMAVVILLCLLSVVSNAQDTVTVKHHAYTTVFAKSAHIPVLVTYALHREQVECNMRVPRVNVFHADPAIPGTSLGRDYSHSGYDQGHNMSAQDNMCDAADMFDCFCYSNMVPQAPRLNRGVWKMLEVQERKMAMDNDSVIVHIGSYGLDHKMGPDSVVVPAYCWKVIYIPKTNTTLTYCFPNVGSVGDNLDDYKIFPSGAGPWLSYLLGRYRL